MAQVARDSQCWRPKKNKQTAVQAQAGVRTHLGKLRAWSVGGGAAPEGIAQLGGDIWTADKPDIENGLKILGSPLGKEEFVKNFSEARVAKEVAYLEMVSQIPDLQCGWVMLSMSAVPRANHMIRMVPPSLVRDYALAHDNAIWTCFCRCLLLKVLWVMCWPVI